MNQVFQPGERVGIVQEINGTPTVLATAIIIGPMEGMENMVPLMGTIYRVRYDTGVEGVTSSMYLQSLDAVAGPIFNNIQQLLDISENIGTITPPEDINMITQEEFVRGEEVIILVENGHNFIFKRPGIIEFFNERIRNNRPLVNPFTNTPIIHPNRPLSTKNPAVHIQIAKISEPEIILTGGRRRKNHTKKQRRRRNRKSRRN